MCVVSMVGDHYQQQWQGLQWRGQPSPFVAGAGDSTPIQQQGLGGLAGFQLQPPISRAEFDELKKEVLEMKDLLLAAKAIDKKTGQPDCEQESKVALLRRVAEAVGVSLDDVFGASAPQ